MRYDPGQRTSAELASLLSGTFAQGTRVWIPASPAWFTDSGSPGHGDMGTYQHGFPGVAFDASSAESVTHVHLLREGWTALDIVLWWANPGTGSGDVVWRAASHDTPAGGDTNTGGTVHSSVTVTASARYVPVETTLKSGLSVTDGELLNIGIQRIGSDGADTLGNDALMFGVELVKAS